MGIMVLIVVCTALFYKIKMKRLEMEYEQRNMLSRTIDESVAYTTTTGDELAMSSFVSSGANVRPLIHRTHLEIE